MVIALLATPLFVPDWRSRNAALALISGALVIAPWLLAWPALLYARSPELYAAWLHKTGLAALAHAPSLAAAGQQLGTLAWFAWPAWPIALWALWLYRRKPSSAAVALPLIALIADWDWPCSRVHRGNCRCCRCCCRWRCWVRRCWAICAAARQLARLVRRHDVQPARRRHLAWLPGAADGLSAAHRRQRGTHRTWFRRAFSPGCRSPPPPQSLWPG